MAMVLLSALAALALAPQPGTVEVPFRVANDALLVDAVVNGSKVSLVFDTGFGGSVLVDDDVDIGPSDGSTTLRDFVGEFDATTTNVKSLQLGPLKIDPTGMVAIRESTNGMSFGYNMHTDGLIGLAAIKNYVTEFDFQRHKLIFYPKSVDISQRSPDDKTTFLAKLLPIGNGSMQMLVTAPNGRKMVMGLDTGNSFYATTHKDVLERVGLWQADRTPKYMHLSGVASGSVDSWTLQMPPLKVFGIPVQSSVWTIIDLPSGSAESDGTVGFEFLKNFNFTIDFDRRRVWFENFTGQTGNEAVADVGISGGFKDRTNQVEVWAVTPGSPADAAGIKKGDEVLSVDGQPVNSTSSRDLESMLDGPPGSTVKIVVSRGGNVLRFELQRQLLVNTSSS